MSRKESAADFLNERRDFLYVYTTRSTSGEGWDVVVRVDGTYCNRDLAELAAEGMRAWLGNLDDLRKDRRHWWQGPPWQHSRAGART